jgi:hypothetical protein
LSIREKQRHSTRAAGGMHRALGILALLCLVPLLGIAQPPSRNVVFNELYAGSRDAPLPPRFIELHNNSDHPLDLSGWRIEGDAVFVFPAGTLLPGGGYGVVTDDAIALRQHEELSGEVVVVEPLLGRVRGRDGYLRLLDAAGVEMDALAYGSFPPWPLEVDGYGASLERIRPDGPSLDPANWRAALADRPSGTPGRRNSAAAAQLPPLVWRVEITPERPKPLEPVRVEAWVQAAPERTSLFVVTHTDTETLCLPMRCEEIVAPTPPAESFLGSPMMRWSAELPGMTTGTLGRVSLRASRTDSEDTITRPWPDYPAWHSAGFMVGDLTPTTSTLAVWRLVLPFSQWQRIEKSWELESFSVPAGLVVGDRFYGHLRLELRGRSSRTYPKKSLKITFPEDRPYADGRDTLYLKGQWTDPSLLRERLAWKIYETLGVPRFRVEPLTLFLNQWYYGVMTDVELPSPQWLARNGLDPRGMYMRLNYPVHPLGVVPALAAVVFRPLEKTSAALSAYDALARRFVETPPERAFPLIEREFDPDQLVSLLLAHALVADFDARFINRAFYAPPKKAPDTRWKLLAWDLDLTFGRYPTEQFISAHLRTDSPALDWMGTWDPLLRGAYLSLEMRERFYRRLRGAVAACLLDEVTSPTLARWHEELGEWGRRDRKRWSGPQVGMGSWDEQPALLHSFINARRHHLVAIEYPQYYRAPVVGPEQLISPPHTVLRDAEGPRRSLSPHWRRVFPLAEFQRAGRWPGLGVWAECAVAADQWLDRFARRPAGRFTFLPGEGADRMCAARFESARLLLLACLGVILLWALSAPPRRAWEPWIGSAWRGGVGGIGLVAMQSVLATRYPQSFPAPGGMDWLIEPLALSCFAVALHVSFCNECNKYKLARLGWGLCLGAAYFLGGFSPASVSVFSPGAPWGLATGVGIAAWVFTREAPTHHVWRRAFLACVYVGLGVGLSAWIGGGGRRPLVLGVWPEIPAAALGLLWAWRARATPLRRAVQAALVTLVAWHLLGDYLAYLEGAWRAHRDSSEARSALRAAVAMQTRLAAPAVVASLLLVLPAWVASRVGGSGLLAWGGRLAAMGLLVLLLGLGGLPLRNAPLVDDSFEGLTCHADELDFELAACEGALRALPGLARHAEHLQRTWYSHPSELGRVPSRRPLLAVQLAATAIAADMGNATQAGATSIAGSDFDHGRLAHAYLIHRHPWMLGEALAAHWAIARPLHRDDAHQLLERLEAGRLDLDFQRSRVFAACLTRRLGDQIHALAESGPARE